MDSKQPAEGRRTIYDRYRELLREPDITDEEIDAMRWHMIQLAQLICEHMWGRGRY